MLPSRGVEVTDLTKLSSRRSLSNECVNACKDLKFGTFGKKQVTQSRQSEMTLDLGIMIYAL